MILVETRYDRIKTLRRRNAQNGAAYLLFFRGGGYIPTPPNSSIVPYVSPAFDIEEEEYFAPKRVLTPLFLFPSLVTVPNLVGLDLLTALTVLSNATLSATIVYQDMPLTIPYNQVNAQSIVAGTLALSGTNVTLTIQGLTIVPNVVGMTISAAQAVLSVAFLTSATIQQVAVYPPGTVFLQDLLPGTGVHVNTVVTLTVAIAGDGFRVQAVTSGFYGGMFRNPGDVFDLLQASDFSDSTLNYEIAGNEVTFGWMLQVAPATSLTLPDGSSFLITADPNRRFVE